MTNILASFHRQIHSYSDCFLVSGLRIKSVGSYNLTGIHIAMSRNCGEGNTKFLASYNNILFFIFIHSPLLTDIYIYNYLLYITWLAAMYTTTCYLLKITC